MEKGARDGKAEARPDVNREAMAFDLNFLWLRLSQKYCQPEFTEGYQIDCQYFGNPDGYRDNMTINSTFETASTNLQSKKAVEGKLLLWKVITLFLIFKLLAIGITFFCY